VSLEARAVEIVEELAGCDHVIAERTGADWCVRCGAYRPRGASAPVWILPTIAAVAKSLDRMMSKRPPPAAD
jgi:hypothetical protein